MLAEWIKPEHRDMGDRSRTVGASEIGLCARRVAYSKAGLVPEQEFPWGYAERGHTVERWVMERLAAAGAPVTSAQEQRTDGPLSCTVDLLLNGEPVDIKSVDPRVTKLPKPEHVLQVQVQAGMWGAARGHLCYVDASDFANIQEFTIEADPKLYVSLMDRAGRILNTLDHPREGKFTGECERCPYQTECLGAPIEGKGKLTEAETLTIERLRSYYFDLVDKGQQIERQASEIKEEIRNILRAADVRRAPGLARISRSARSTLDQKALEAAGIDLTPYRKPGRESESVTIE